MACTSPRTIRSAAPLHLAALEPLLLPRAAFWLSVDTGEALGFSGRPTGAGPAAGSSLWRRGRTSGCLARSLGLLTSLSGFLASSPAQGQGNSYAAPIGGRSALMGDTGTALGVDGSAPFLNPATIVRMDEHRFAFSVNFYQYSITQLQNWHQPGAVDNGQFGNLALSNTSISSSGFGVLPSTLCLFFTTAEGEKPVEGAAPTLRPGRQKLSLCLGSAESSGISFTALPFTGTTPLGLTTQAQSVTQSWSRFYGGPSYSISVARHLALGASLHVIDTSDSFALASGAITASMANAGVQSSLAAAGSGSSIDSALTLGGIYRAGDYTAGLSVVLPAVHFTGSYTGSYDNEYSSGTTGMARISSGSGSFSAGPPIRIALGGGAEWKRLTMEVDAAIVIPSLNGFTASASGTTATLAANKLTSVPFQASFSIREHPVVNPGVGWEYFVTPTFSVVGGAALNLTLEPPLSTALTVGTLVEQRQSSALVSAGVGSYSTAGNLLVGVQLSHGWGQVLAANPYVTPNEWAIVDTSSYGVVLILAGSTSLRSLGHAAERLGDVVHFNADAQKIEREAVHLEKQTEKLEKEAEHAITHPAPPPPAPPPVVTPPAPAPQSPPRAPPPAPAPVQPPRPSGVAPAT